MVRMPRPRRPRVPRLGLVPRLVAALMVVAVAAGAYAFWPRHQEVRVTGEFTRAVGLFPGSEVRILGVKVGKVTEVTPVGDKVRVRFQYDARYKVPAGAKAAVVAPSLVSDRYVQLLPAYTGGPVMRTGARIPLERTAVPVELDRISKSLDDLLVALGPTGANKDGALQDLLHTGAKNLDGQGQAIHDTNHDLSLALQTLSGGRNDLFGTVKNLQTFTSMLATNDQQVRRLNTDLANVSDQLEGERGDMAAALKNLAVALDEVSSFVHDNRAGLGKNIGQLASVTGTVAKDRDALAETLSNAPVALSNLQNAYNPASGTLDTRAAIGENLQQLDLQTLVCGLVDQKNPAAKAICDQVKKLGPVDDLLGKLQGSGVLLPSHLLSALPQSQTGPAAAGTVQLRGADPTLGGLLGKGARP
jgi:phospholipid/cholesterol/gamma-HCH transport system substrate-binding protein